MITSTIPVLKPDFKALFESAPGSYLVLTPDFTITAVSDAYLRVTKTNREEILGKGLFNVFPDNPDDVTASGVSNLRSSLQSVLQNRSSHTMAVQKYDIPRLPSGGSGFEEKYWSFVNSPVFGLDGEITYIIHQVEDITEFIRLKKQESEQHHLNEDLQKRTEQIEAQVNQRSQELEETNKQLQIANRELAVTRDAAYQAQEKLTTILESITDGFFAVDRDWYFTYVNQEAARLLQKNPQELVGKQVWQDVFPEAINTALKSELDRAMECEVPVNLEQFYPPLDKCFEIYAYPCATGLSIYFRDITKRKQAEQEREEANRRTTNILESITDAFIALDSEWRITYVNQEAAKLIGKKPEEFIGKNYWEVWPWAVDTVIEQEYRRAVADRVAVHFEVLYEPLNLWLETHAYPSLDGLSIYLHDITQRKQVEEALRAAEARLQLAMAAADLGAWELDLATQDFPRRSLRHDRIFGYESPLEEWNFDIFIQHVHPDDRQQVTQHYQQAFAIGGTWEFECRIFRADGQLRWIWVRGSIRHDRQNNSSWALGVVQDITDRKRAEETLRTSEERFQLLLENVRDYAIFFLDNENRVTGWSLGAQRVLGYQEAEILGEFGSIIFIPEDLKKQAHLQELEKAVTEGRAENERWHLRKDGSCFWGSGIVIPLRDEAGNLKGFSKIMRDFTDRKLAEDERNRLLEREQEARTQAEAANRIKDEFLAVLSHELRSPLNPILGWATLLRSRTFEPRTFERGLETIERNAKLQTQLIDDLLDVSRILRGKMSLEVAPVNLVSIIEAAIETVRLAAETKSIQIQTVFDPSVGMVTGDPNRLQQVVWNLLFNAVKFTPHAGRVEVRLDSIESQAQIQVIDTGKGINPNFLPHVFDYFRQENSTTTRVFGGLGLGLAIVRHLVELHGGTVWAESPGEGQGATFTIRLPLLTIPPQTEENCQQPNIALNLRGVKILVVDDDVDSREFITFVLEQSGATVTSLPSALEALTALANTKPDLLISDIGMPEMDGYMLIRQVRAMRPDQGRNIPAIALSAYASESDSQQALKAGFQRHIAKPIEPEKLISLVANLIGRTSHNGKRKNKLF